MAGVVGVGLSFWSLVVPPARYGSSHQDHQWTDVVIEPCDVIWTGGREDRWFTCVMAAVVDVGLLGRQWDCVGAL